jgi:hypothetical protein
MITPSVFLAEIARYFVGLLLLAAAVGKLRGFARFRANLSDSFDVSAAAGRILAPALVLAELVVAALVLWGGDDLLGMQAALLLFGLFSALIAVKFYTQSVVRCGCFGEAERALSGYDLLRNALVIGAIGMCLAFDRGATLPPHAAVLAVALAALACVVAIHFHEILVLLAAPHG